MIINCEECGKRYRIDVTKMREKKARGQCTACQHIIEVDKPEPEEDLNLKTEEMAAEAPLAASDSALDTIDQMPETTAVESQAAESRVKTATKAQKSKLKGLSIGLKLFAMFLSFVVVLGSVVTMVYMKYVPSMMSEQISLRTYSVSKSFSAAVLQPFLLRNYLMVNKTAEVNSTLPGVAYVSVINKKGMVIAGLFGDLNRFSPEFSTQVKKEGFPSKLSRENRIREGSDRSAKDLTIGGQKIHDVAVPVGDTGGEAHVGLFTEDVDKAIRQSLTPLIIILVAMAVLGSISFLMVARTITNPIKALTESAHRISLGEIDLPISVKGGGEIGELASSLERMRFSVKSAIDRLRRR